jgi:hypothetical protein
VAEVAEVGIAVVVGAAIARTIPIAEGVVVGAVVEAAAEGVAASKEVRRKDAGKAPQPAGPSYFLNLPPTYRRWLPLILLLAVLGSALLTLRLKALRLKGWRLLPGPPLPVYPVVRAWLISHTAVNGVPGLDTIRGASPRYFFLAHSSTRVSLSTCLC